MAVYKRGCVWWYRFTWKGEPIRESTKQTNKRVAEQIEAAHKTSLAKGEVGIRDRKPAATIRQFANPRFPPFLPVHVRGQAEDAVLLRERNGATPGVSGRRGRIARHDQRREDRRIRAAPAGCWHEGRHGKPRASGFTADVCARDGMGKGGASSSAGADDSWRSASGSSHQRERGESLP